MMPFSTVLGHNHRHYHLPYTEPFMKKSYGYIGNMKKITFKTNKISCGIKTPTIASRSKILLQFIIFRLRDGFTTEGSTVVQPISVELINRKYELHN